MHDSGISGLLLRRQISDWLEDCAQAATVSDPEKSLAKALAEYLCGAPALPMPMDDVSFFYRMEADRGGNE